VIVVLDTNVLVTGLLNPYGPCGEIVRLVAAGDLRLCFDARLLAEYEEVLLRPKFGFEADKVRLFLAQLEDSGLLAVARPLPDRLPDPDDEPFLAIALAGPAECLVTGNARHFPTPLRRGVSVLSPAEFLDLHRAGTHQ
jgi:putative PIN family toxin of toxin-antitoxin system